MKNSIYLIVLFAASTVGLATSCSSDFLDETLTTQYSTDHFKTPSGLDELSVGTYQKLKFQFNYTWGIKAFNWGVDEFTDANNSGPEYNNYGETLNSTNTEVNSPIWDNYFSGIE
ncbi:MAG: RagB/SusD family nutrient uptake outer membrane protein, partial [Prevotella sp.]|nr:RagB/SusD family nutrient uptake outer membrane protein [Prevotella sp.]